MTVFVEDATLMQSLRRGLAAGARRAAERGEPVLVSVSAAVPAIDAVTLFETARPAGEERAYWEQPREHSSLVAIGAAVNLSASGSSRIDDVSTAWGRLTAAAISVGDIDCAAPVGLGGFAFQPANGRDSAWQGYPEALLTVPRFLFVTRNGASYLIASALAGAGRDADAEAEAMFAELTALLARTASACAPEQSRSSITVAEDAGAAQWREAVAAIGREIQSGAVRKLVLAREVRAHADLPLARGPVLRRLRTRYEGCTTFAFARGNSCFLGATPERLVRLEGNDLLVDCLAGSAPRAAAEDEDRALGQRLLRDEKELLEHSLVVDALRDTLAPLCTTLDMPDQPRLLLMPNVQHLHTPVAGTLIERRSVLDLVARLHPTPAAGGVPQAAAGSLIRSYESFDRGWYTGPVGWIDGRGGGEFVVAIRSALLREQDALLYAGCGIVAGSDPEREYQESRLKLEPMLWAMNGRS